MIINTIIDMFTVLLNRLIDLLPKWDFHVMDHIGGLDAFIRFLWQFDDIVPVHETFECLTLALGLWAFMFSWKYIVKGLDWVADILP
jgi:hypothetical protein